MSEKFFKAYRFLLLMVFLLISLGAAVRAMNAGLACPDWPLCFGDFIPDYHPQVYFEFIHRALAGIVAIVTITLHWAIFRNKKSVPENIRMMAVFSVFLLLLQVVLGGLTVLLKLHEEVVAAHLSLGTGFFGVLTWIYFSLRYGSLTARLSQIPVMAKVFAYGSAVAVYMQIVLGGFVASHYAALVCVDFPTCHGQWIPTLQGIIGLQVIHRLGAYALTLALVCYATYLLMNYEDKLLRRGAWATLILIFCQVAVGISNVLLMRPPIITVAHLALGTALLGLSIFLTRRLAVAHSAST